MNLSPKTNKESEANSENKPIIISSSITGLLISHSLSKHHIAHVLIGGERPKKTPRLGESINQTTSIDFWRFLGTEYMDCFNTKSHISLFNGDFSSMIYLGNPGRSIEQVPSLINKSLFKLFSASLIHADRSVLDLRLYDNVISNKYCDFVKSKIAEIEYDKDRDKIAAVHLENKFKYNNPLFVFDASGRNSLLQKNIPVKKEKLGNDERIIWGHFLKHSINDECKNWWQHGTNLLRLDAERNGLDGISWLIPLKDKISVGISIDAHKYPDSQLSRMEVMAILIEAYSNRGVQLEGFYDTKVQINEDSHTYYVMEKAYGKNWLLAGPSFISIWFPSSSGLATSMAAAHVSPFIIKQSKEFGEFYESSLRNFLNFHTLINSMVQGKPFKKYYEVYRFWAKWVSPLPYRLTQHLTFLEHGIESNSFRKKIAYKLSNLFSKYYFLQLIFMGFFITNISKKSFVERNNNLVKNYFRPQTFILSNYFRGWGVFLKSRFTDLLIKPDRNNDKPAYKKKNN